jgi:hypothetical protein
MRHALEKGRSAPSELTLNRPFRVAPPRLKMHARFLQLRQDSLTVSRGLCQRQTPCREAPALKLFHLASHTTRWGRRGWLMMHLRLTHKERHRERSPSCLHIARADLTATLLTNSQVQVVGGLDTNYNVLASARQASWIFRKAQLKSGY